MVPDTDADWFKVRGFDAASYLDGNRLFSTGYGCYVWTPEPFGLESVEVLKGLTSILYGEAPRRRHQRHQQASDRDPAGLVNLQLGNRDLRQVGVDVSDTLPTTAGIVWWPSATSGTACWMAPTTSAPIWRRA